MRCRRPSQCAETVSRQVGPLASYRLVGIGISTGIGIVIRIGIGIGIGLCICICVCIGKGKGKVFRYRCRYRSRYTYRVAFRSCGASLVQPGWHPIRLAPAAVARRSEYVSVARDSSYYEECADLDHRAKLSGSRTRIFL